MIVPLFVPGERPDRFEKAAVSGADGIIFDLEDAVTPAAKDRAREAIAAAELSPELPAYIRVNARNTPWYESDLAMVAALPGTGIMIPKVESTADVEDVRRYSGSDRPVIALIETAAGIANARTIASAEGVTRLAFGLVDFCADVGCAPVREALLPARWELILASRLAGLAPPLDGISTDLKNPDILAEDARYAAVLGFGGKLCIHPAQIAVVMAGFTPSHEELAWAQRILAMKDEGAAAIDGRMVDAAELRRARGILYRHQQISSKTGKKI